MSIPHTKAVSTDADDIGQIAGGATDTNTIAITNTTHYAKWYGTTVSQNVATTATAELDIQVKLGSTVVAVASATMSTTGLGLSICEIAPPPGCHVQGAAGEDIVIVITNNAGSGSAEDVVSTTYYSEEKVTKGN